MLGTLLSFFARSIETFCPDIRTLKQINFRNMKRVLLTLFSVLFVAGIYAQGPSVSDQNTSPETTAVTEVDDTEETSPFTLATGVGLYSRYFWRGVKFGSGASIQGYADLSMTNEQGTGAFGIGAFAAANFNGFAMDYGNTMNLYLYYTQDLGDNSNLTIYLDDYYFYNEDNLGMTFDYEPETTLHYIEARVEATVGDFDGILGYSIYQGQVTGMEVDDEGNAILVDQDTAPYIEVGYAVNEDTRIFAGGVTGPSALNFQTNSGITNIGVTQSREIRNIPFEFTFACNPSYKKISDFSAGRPATASAFSFVAAIVLE